jgi:Tol biopolymer transport system component
LAGTYYVINTDGSGRKQLVKGDSAVWSPDGQKIAFVLRDSNLPNVWLLHVMNADGSGLRRLANTIATLPAWSPDGEKIAFPCPSSHGGENADLCVINADGTEWKRIALNVGSVGTSIAVLWGREKQR